MLVAYCCSLWFVVSDVFAREPTALHLGAEFKLRLRRLRRKYLLMKIKCRFALLCS